MDRKGDLNIRALIILAATLAGILVIGYIVWKIKSGLLG